MHVSGVALRIRPQGITHAVDALQKEQGVECHHVEYSTSTIIATVERPTLQALVDTMHRVERIPAVLWADVAFHAFEDVTDLGPDGPHGRSVSPSEEPR